ncbi:unnamed protein product, partial [Polarella glacialis]
MASNVMRLRLFSPNEELDDINTADLKFLLVPYLLAEVTAATRDMESRLSSLKRALVYWRAFSADCQRLQVAHADDLRAIDRSPEDALDPASKREEKIDRYKRCKELDQKAAYLFSKKREVCGDEFHWGAGGSFDEDMERELVLALLGRAVASVPDQISSTEQELPLLEMMMARGGPGTGPIERPPPAEKPMIVRIQDKAELNKLYREMVFQCPYELPTVTLAEVAEAEMAEMHEREAAKFHHDRRSGADEADRWWSGDRQGAREDAEEEQKIYKALGPQHPTPMQQEYQHGLRGCRKELLEREVARYPIGILTYNSSGYQVSHICGVPTRHALGGARPQPTRRANWARSHRKGRGESTGGCVYTVGPFVAKSPCSGSVFRPGFEAAASAGKSSASSGSSHGASSSAVFARTVRWQHANPKVHASPTQLKPPGAAATLAVVSAAVGKLCLPTTLGRHRSCRRRRAKLARACGAAASGTGVDAEVEELDIKPLGANGASRQELEEAAALIAHGFFVGCYDAAERTQLPPEGRELKRLEQQVY